MLYLIGQIFVFLMLALGAGLGLGWLAWGLAPGRPKRLNLIEGDTLGMQLARARIELERQTTVTAALRKKVAECEREIVEHTRRIHELEPAVLELAEYEQAVRLTLEHRDRQLQKALAEAEWLKQTLRQYEISHLALPGSGEARSQPLELLSGGSNIG